MKAIEISGLTKTFRGKRWSRVEALKGLDLEVESGEVFGFLGPNGAGKSTTIKVVMGLIRPTSGSAKILGEDAVSHQARKHVGYLPENPAFFDYLTAEEYLKFVGKSFAMPDHSLTSRIEVCLKRMELWEARKRRIRGYSKGMVQRMGLAQVLLHDPDILILDEPMSGLDPLGRALVKEIILDLKGRGKTIFFSSHITSDMESICDRVGIILKGELKSVERIATIMNAGIMGYTVQMRMPDGGQITESYVSKEQLASFFSEMQHENREITLVEPRRKDLEQFFLDIVGAKTC